MVLQVGIWFAKKNFAKQKILWRCVIIAPIFDIEILANNKMLKLDLSTYSLEV